MREALGVEENEQIEEDENVENFPEQIKKARRVYICAFLLIVKIQFELIIRRFVA